MATPIANGQPAWSSAPAWGSEPAWGRFCMKSTVPKRQGRSQLESSVSLILTHTSINPGRQWGPEGNTHGCAEQLRGSHGSLQ
jgi:hypothetical protein